MAESSVLRGSSLPTWTGHSCLSDSRLGVADLVCFSAPSSVDEPQSAVPTQRSTERWCVFALSNGNDRLAAGRQEAGRLHWVKSGSNNVCRQRDDAPFGGHRMVSGMQARSAAGSRDRTTQVVKSIDERADFSVGHRAACSPPWPQHRSPRRTFVPGSTTSKPPIGHDSPGHSESSGPSHQGVRQAYD